MLCQYSEIFGKVGEGVHATRVFDIAVIDVFFTFLLAYIITLAGRQKKYWRVLGTLFLAGILAHRIFCVRTTVDKFLFH